MITRRNFLASDSYATVGVAMLPCYPTRVSMLHVKDFKPTATPAAPASRAPAAEPGDGTAQYASIFPAARKASIKHYFVEHEKYEIPMCEALKQNADYTKRLDA